MLFNFFSPDINKNPELLFLKGRALNILPDFNQECHELLSKAVKLDPSLTDAWIDLGESFWKLKDAESAKNCFMGTLKRVRRVKEINIYSLREVIPIFSFLGKLAMHTCCMASTVCTMMRCNLCDTYHMQCIVYIPDSEQTVHVDMWREDCMDSSHNTGSV